MMHVGWPYYVTILALIGAAVGAFLYFKKKQEEASRGGKPPQKGIIR